GQRRRRPGGRDVGRGGGVGWGRDGAERRGNGYAAQSRGGVRIVVGVALFVSALGFLRRAGRLVPWILDRTIELTDQLRVSYVYRNAGTEALPAYWCAHPLFKYEPGMAVGAPAPGEGSSAKVHLAPGSIDRMTLRWRSGAGVEMSWDIAVTPYVAIWVCNGDLGGYRQIAIEPATGGNDRPDPSAPPPLLEPG